MCKKCKIQTDDTVVVELSEKVVLAWSQAIAFTHAGHYFAGTFSESESQTYSLVLDTESDAQLLGDLLTSQDFLGHILMGGIQEHVLRTIFKAPHVFYVREPEEISDEGLSLDD
jgi:hypothetical protein